MSTITLKGDIHISEKDFQDVKDALASGVYDTVFVEDRERMTEDSGEGFFFSLLYFSTQFFYWVMELFHQTGSDDKELEKYGWKIIDAPIDLLHRKMSIFEKSWNLFVAIIFAFSLFQFLSSSLMFYNWLRFPYLFISSLAIAPFYFVAFQLRVIWDREKYMVEKLIQEAKSEESIYVYVGDAHLLGLRWLLRNEDVELEVEPSKSILRFTTVFTSIGFRLFTPLKTISVLWRQR
jgi:hypothetical protein